MQPFGWPLIRLLIALSLAWVVAPVIAFALLMVLIVSGAVSTWTGLRRYSPTLPLAALVLTGVCFALVGLRAEYTCGVLAGCSFIVLVARHRRISVESIPFIGRQSDFLLFAIPFGTWALVRVIDGNRAFAWALQGDAGILIQYQQITGTLTGTEFLSFALLSRTVGSAVLGSSIAGGWATVAGATLSASAAAAIGVAVLTVLLAVAQLVRSAWGREPWWVGAVAGVAALSGLLLGFIASNGYLSVGPTLALYVLAVTAIAGYWRSRQWVDLLVFLLACIALCVTWALLAAALCGILLAVLLAGRRAALPIAGLALAVGAFAAVLVLGLLVQGPLAAFWGGYFPATPFGFFLLSTGLALVAARGRSVFDSLVFSASAIAGTCAMFLVVSPASLTQLMALSYFTNSSDYYYVRKFAWIAFIPVVIVALIWAVRWSCRRGGAVGGVLVSVCLVAAMFWATPVPNVPWASPATTSDATKRGELVTRSIGPGQAVLYYNYVSPEVDGALNDLFSLNWARYQGAGAGKLGELGSPVSDQLFVPEFASWSEACAYFSSLPSGRLLVTRDVHDVGRCDAPSQGK